MLIAFNAISLSWVYIISFLFNFLKCKYFKLELPVFDSSLSQMEDVVEELYSFILVSQVIAIVQSGYKSKLVLKSGRSG